MTVSGNAPATFHGRSTDHIYVPPPEGLADCDRLMSDGKRCGAWASFHSQTEPLIELSLTTDLVVFVTAEQQRRIAALSGNQCTQFIERMTQSTQTYTDLGWPRHQFEQDLDEDLGMCGARLERKFAPGGNRLFSDTACGHTIEHHIHIA